MDLKTSYAVEAIMAEPLSKTLGKLPPNLILTIDNWKRAKIELGIIGSLQFYYW